MIQIYVQNNTNFDKHGDITLTPTSCEVTMELNSSWSLTLDHTIDEEGRWKYIEAGAVIKAPSYNGEQLFRIIEREKSDSGVSARAEPIFLDSIGDCFLQDVRPTEKNGQQALDIILADSQYHGISNIRTVSTAYYYYVNAMEAIAGDSENSFLNRWGGEIYYDNFTITINDRIGADRGVEILYGKNIPVDGLSEAVDYSEVVTRIIPKAYNGRMKSGTKWVDSHLINRYPTTHTKVIEYPNIVLKNDVDGTTEGKQICNTQADLDRALTEAAQNEFTIGIDKPKVTIDLDVVLLANTEEYKEFAELERIGLGDTIHCKHSRLDVVTDARVVELTYDSIRDAVTNVTIGQAETNIMNRITSSFRATEKALTKDGRVNADRIEGFINGALAQLRIQNTIAERQSARAILFEDLDETSPTYGAMALGTQGFQISKQRTPDGTDWVWSTFGTSDGFNANFINAGEINALDIKGSRITGGTINGTTMNASTINGTNIIGSTIDGNNILGGNKS